MQKAIKRTSPTENKGQRQVRAISKAEVLAYTQDYKEQLRYRALAAFMFLTGARISEALNVYDDDIKYMQHNGISIARVKLITLKQRGIKKNRPRYVFVDLDDDGDLWLCFQQYAKRIVVPHSKVFNFHRWSGWAHIKKHFKERDHALRHAFVDYMSEKGLSASYVLDSLGDSAQMLDVYKHKFEERTMLDLLTRNKKERIK